MNLGTNKKQKQMQMRNPGYIKVQLIALLLCATSVVTSQTLTNQVLNSAGDERAPANAGISITDNIGEPFTTTYGPLSSMMITQGFLQPELKSGLLIMKSGLSCTGRNDGYISVALNSVHKEHQEQYFWSPSSACPKGDCMNKVDNLFPGLYSVQVVSSYSVNGVLAGRDSLNSSPIEIIDSSEPCLIKVYTGVTPNNDGVNDTWYIENISMFPKNSVSVYNRWGNLMYEEKGYDNTSRYWPTDEHQKNLVSSTYFYIIDLGDGSRPLKGWVEYLKN
jgi:gliding motility-associated-like protein